VDPFLEMTDGLFNPNGVLGAMMDLLPRRWALIPFSKPAEETA